MNLGEVLGSFVDGQKIKWLGEYMFSTQPLFHVLIRLRDDTCTSAVALVGGGCMRSGYHYFCIDSWNIVPYEMAWV